MKCTLEFAQRLLPARARALGVAMLGRTAVPEDVACIVAFLATEDAAYITGQSIIVGGEINMV